MMTGTTGQHELIARIERALLLLAWFIELDGDVHVPMYEKFEAELADLRAREDVKIRAGERLAAYRRSSERNGIGFGHAAGSANETVPNIPGL